MQLVENAAKELSLSVARGSGACSSAVLEVHKRLGRARRSGGRGDGVLLSGEIQALFIPAENLQENQAAI